MCLDKKYSSIYTCIALCKLLFVVLRYLTNIAIYNLFLTIIIIFLARSFEELGTGEFGVVNRGKWKPSSTKEVEVAIKTLNTNSTDKNRVRFLQEAAIMCQFDHENVIMLHGVVIDAPSMIVLEYMSRGDLRSLLLKLQSS